MYVKKFEGESLDSTLKLIKSELGPDAIILKTITNKGLKGAFKKAKYEITAAISERNYTKKAKVDNVLDTDQKEQFYNAPSSHISNMIDQYNGHEKGASPAVAAGGYGNIALNKQVKTTQPEPQVSQLDSFLSSGVDEAQVIAEKDSFEAELAKSDENIALAAPQVDAAPVQQEKSLSNTLLIDQQKKIDIMEKQLYQLSQNLNAINKKEAFGLYSLRTTLRSLDISEAYVQNIIKKATFELSEDDLEDDEATFEFALREIMDVINTDLPLFSRLDGQGGTLTVLLSETSVGQSSMCLKVQEMDENSIILRLNADNNTNKFAQHLLESKVICLDSVAEIVSEARKRIEQGQNVIVDYKPIQNEFNDTKTFLDGLRRSFKDVEVLVSLSAIHSELYNRKIVNQYRTLSDGLVLTHLDECLNYGAVFNVHESANDLPLIFFGTGRKVPTDIETATPERLLGGMFKFE